MPREYTEVYQQEINIILSCISQVLHSITYGVVTDLTQIGAYFYRPEHNEEKLAELSQMLGVEVYFEDHLHAVARRVRAILR
jgi:hypothetical protein